MTTLPLLEPFDSIISAGIDLERDVALLPTLIWEGTESVEIECLDCAPDYSEAHEKAHAWFAQTAAKKSSYIRSCLAFMPAENVIQAVVRSGSQEAAFFGRIDREQMTLSWSDQRLA